MRVYDFTCTKCGTTAERFVKNCDVHEVECKLCDGKAHRELCTPRFALDPNDKAGFPGAYHSWEKQFKQKRDNASKSESE